MIELVGGNFSPPFNLLHENFLEYLIEAAQSEMFGQPMCAQIHEKAGVYMFNIIANHIFLDGNKRTGLETAMLFLRLNNCQINRAIPDEVLIGFTTEVASGGHTLENVQEWFRLYIVFLS